MIHIMATASTFFALVGFVCCWLVKNSASVSSMKISRNAWFSGGHVMWTTHAYNIFPCAAICLQLTNCQSVSFLGNINECYFYSNMADTNINPLSTLPGTDYVDASTIPGDFAGNCKEHACALDELCVPRRTSGHHCIPYVYYDW